MVVVEAKILAVLIGMAIAAVGVGFVLFGAPLTALLNQMYSRLPGKFQYPMWFHRVFGGTLVAFGLLFALVGGLTAKSMP